MTDKGRGGECQTRIRGRAASSENRTWFHRGSCTDPRLTKLGWNNGCDRRQKILPEVYRAWYYRFRLAEQRRRLFKRI